MYFVYEMVDRQFDIVDTKKEAIELANYYQKSIEEYARYDGEYPTGSRIIVAEIVEEIRIAPIFDTGYYKFFKYRDEDLDNLYQPLSDEKAKAASKKLIAKFEEENND
jgi:hypothetical protein